MALEHRISELDTYLFAKGTHYEIYEKMGAHLAEEDGKAGTYFSVWAPNARSVSVVGDFNNWDRMAHPMQPVQQSGKLRQHLIILIVRIHNIMVDLAPSFFKKRSALDFQIVSVILDDIMQ